MKKTLKLTAICVVLAILCVCLVACIPSDYNKAISNLKDDGYVVAAYAEGDIGFTAATASLTLAGVKNVTAFVTGIKSNEVISMVYFKDTAAAKDNYAALEKVFKDEDESKDMVIKRSGKVIYAGTENAIKAVK